MRNWIIATAALGTLIAACGQNAHVTQPDPTTGPVGSPISHHHEEPGVQQPAPGTDPGPSQPTQPGLDEPSIPCFQTVKQRYALREVLKPERDTLELPYEQGPRHCRSSCNSGKAPTQLVLAADLNQLPKRNLVGKIRKLSVDLKIVRTTNGLAGNELFCLVNERLCSGTRGDRDLNSDFWMGMSENEIKFMGSYYVELLKNEKLWQQRRFGVGKKSAEFSLDFNELTRGTRYNLENVLYSGSTHNQKTLYLVIADEVATCSGELVVEMEVNTCPTNAGGNS